MNDIELRPVTEEERVPYLRYVTHAFHEFESDDLLEAWLPMMRDGRYDVALRDGEMVGSCATMDTTLSVPGGRVGCAAITAVTVRTDVRRQGLLTRMMRRMFDEAIERGHEVAALYVSEGGIYGRFGYGPAVQMRSVEVSAARAVPRVDADLSRVRIVTADQARELAPSVLDRVAATRGGLIGVTPGWWDLLTVVDPPEDRDGWTPRTFAAVDDLGLVSYRAKDSGGEDQAGRLKVEPLLAADPETFRALWGFVASVDLIGTIEVPARPVDDPLLHLLPDEVRIRMSRWHSLWVRLLDVPAAMRARTTTSTGTLVIEVTDEMLPVNAGRWRLVGDGVVDCVPTTDAADLSLDVAALSSLYLGGVRAASLLDAGQVTQHTAGAVAELDRLVAVDRSPWAPFMF